MSDDFVADPHYDRAAAWAAGDDEAFTEAWMLAVESGKSNPGAWAETAEDAQETAQAEGLAAADLDPDWPGHGDER